MAETHLENLRQEIAVFLKRIEAEEAILFGSRACGEELSTSDVDLIVISQKFFGQPFPERMVALHRDWRLPMFLEALPYTPDELMELAKSRGVVAEALKSGIRIYPGNRAA